MTKTTLRERVRALEVLFDERTKNISNELTNVKSELTGVKKVLNGIQDGIDNHLKKLDKRVYALETGQLTKREKIKVYGSIAAAIIVAVASIISNFW